MTKIYKIAYKITKQMGRDKNMKDIIKDIQDKKVLLLFFKKTNKCD